MAAPVRNTTAQDAARWQRALQRAHAEHIRLYQDVNDGAYYALSSDGRTLYAVGEHFCSCKAGQEGMICKHRAALLERLGKLTLATDASTPVHAVPAPTPKPAITWRDLTDDGTDGLTQEEIGELKRDAAKLSREIGFLVSWRDGSVHYDQPVPGWRK